jgi:hypothetical protein
VATRCRRYAARLISQLTWAYQTVPSTGDSNQVSELAQHSAFGCVLGYHVTPYGLSLLAACSIEAALRT